MKTAMKTGCLCLWFSLSFSLAAFGEDFLWEGKIYRDVKVDSSDSPEKGDDRMVILSSPSGYVTVPYKRLSWPLQREADAMMDMLDISPEKMVGKKWLIGRYVRNTPSGVVMHCRAARGMTASSKIVARGRVMLRNFKPASRDFDKDNIKVLAWDIGRQRVEGEKGTSYYPTYDMNPPVLIPERDWTDKKGRKVKAALAAVSDKHVVLLRSGKPVTLAKDLLSPEDVAFIDEQMKEKKTLK